MMDEGRKRRMHQSEHPVAAVVFSLAWILLYAVERNRVDCLWVSLPGALATVIEILSDFNNKRGNGTEVPSKSSWTDV